MRALWLHDFMLPPLSSAAAGSPGRRFDNADLTDALTWYKSGGLGTAPAAIAHLERLRSASGTAAYRTQILSSMGPAWRGSRLGTVDLPGSPSSTTPSVGVAPKAGLIFLAIGGHDEKRFANDLDVHSAFQKAFDDGSEACVALLANSDNLGPMTARSQASGL